MLRLPTRSELEALQLEQLRSLVAELIPANKFYTQKLQAAGVGFDIASLADFSARFPFTTKAELVADQLAHPPFGTNLTYPLNRYTRFHQTSGTSGAPLRWLDTPESWEAMLECWTEVFRAAGVGAGDRVMFAFSFGPFLGFWLAFEAAARRGALCLPGGGLGSAARLRVMQDNGVNVLCCTPTYALRLAEVAAEEKIAIPALGVKTIIVAGEPGGSIPATRAKLESLWPGARIFDHHGMTEVGPVTFECPAKPGVLHVIESAYYAEVIDPASGQPASKGRTGLNHPGPHRLAAVALSHGRPGEMPNAECRMPNRACACGRFDLALEGGILGRVDDMIIVRGVNIYPSAVEEIIRGFAEVAEYRVHVSAEQALTEMRVEIEPVAGAAAPALATQLEQLFHKAFALRVPVSVVAAGTLPRFEMKAMRQGLGFQTRS